MAGKTKAADRPGLGAYFERNAQLASVSLKEVIGEHYTDFWRFKGRYRVVKGSRASKKSKTTALWLIWNMMKYPEANALVVRKVFRTLKDSCFTELKWAIHRLGVAGLWKVTESPLEMTYMPTGQKIYFRGLDDPLKITSIAAGTGHLCWGWVEECYEIDEERDFDTLDESLRGKLPEGLFYQWTLTFNPWTETWLKRRFFDAPSDSIMAMTTNYLMNEFIDTDTLKMFEEMEQRNPERYQVAGLGNWGIPAEGLYFKRSQIGNFVQNIPGDVIKWVRAWDLAATTEKENKDAAYTAGVLIGKRKDGSYIVADVINAQLSAAEVRQTIRKTAQEDRAKFGRVTIRLPQDPGQAGKAQAQSMVKLLAGFNVKALPESGSKETRAEPMAAQWQAGNFDLLAACWNEAYIRQLEAFPMGKFKDMVDASGAAFNEIEEDVPFSLEDW